MGRLGALNAGKRLLEVLFPLANYGVGSRVTRATWSTPNCFWEITKCARPAPDTIESRGTPRARAATGDRRPATDDRRPPRRVKYNKRAIQEDGSIKVGKAWGTLRGAGALDARVRFPRRLALAVR